MNRPGYYILMLLFVIAVAACKKDKDDVAQPGGIVGYWRGKLGGGTSYPTAGYAVIFRSNGTMRVFSTGDTATANKSEGVYTVSGSAVSGTYTYFTGMAIQINITSTVDPKFVFIEGDWKPENNPISTTGGKFFLLKQ